MRISAIITTCAGLFIQTGSLFGATTTYSSQATFNTDAGAFGTLTVESYEGYSSDLASGARTINLSSAAVSYDLDGDISNFGIATVPNPFGGTGVSATDGSNYLFVVYPTSSVPGGASVTFQFANPISVFGTNMRDVENISISYETSEGENGTAASPAANGAVQFFGIISDTPFTSITFSGPGVSTGDGVVFDETTYVIPEPSTTALLAGMCAFAFRRKRS